MGGSGNSRFPITLRGYAKIAVDQYFNEQALKMDRLAAENQSLSKRVNELERRANEAPIPTAQLSTEAIATALGEEATAVLRSAAAAATNIRSKAEEYEAETKANAESALEQARMEAEQLLEATNELLRKRSQEQEQLAIDLLRKANDEANAAIASGRDRADAIIDEAKKEEQRIMDRAKEGRDYVMRQLAEQVEAIKSEIYSLVNSREQVMSLLRLAQTEVSRVERSLERSATLEMEVLYKALRESPLEIIDLEAIGVNPNAASGTTTDQTTGSATPSMPAETAEMPTQDEEVVENQTATTSSATYLNGSSPERGSSPSWNAGRDH
jgi:cell division septum initiation protein DivIVA